MFIHQISVFVENRAGRLSEITDVLSKENIDIRALSIADTTDFGILRLIVRQPDKACEALKNAGFTTKLTKVLAAHLSDTPGALHNILKNLYAHDIVVEYIYAFITRKEDDAYVIVRVEDIEKASEVLQAGGIKLLSAAECYDI